MKAFTVLIVDDDPDMRLYLRGCLRGLGDGGATVLEAADGTEALRLFTSSPVDLVISDVILPRLDGRSLLQGDPERPGSPPCPGGFSSVARSGPGPLTALRPRGCPSRSMRGSS